MLLLAIPWCNRQSRVSWDLVPTGAEDHAFQLVFQHQRVERPPQFVAICNAQLDFDVQAK